MTGANINNVMISIKVVSATYKSRGSTIVTVVADNGFSALDHNPEFIELQITLNLTAMDEHEPYIERFNETIKNSRMGIVGVPFTKLPKRMVVELVYAIIF